MALEHPVPLSRDHDEDMMPQDDRGQCLHAQGRGRTLHLQHKQCRQVMPHPVSPTEPHYPYLSNTFMATDREKRLHQDPCLSPTRSANPKFESTAACVPSCWMDVCADLRYAYVVSYRGSSGQRWAGQARE